MRTTLLTAAALGVLAGFLLPVGGRGPAAPPAPEAEAAAPTAPSLATSARRAPAPAEATPAAPAAPPPATPAFGDGLAPPHREWAIIDRDESLDHDGRMRALLGAATRFAAWRQHDWARRTLQRVIEHTGEDTALRQEAEVALAWNEHVRGEVRAALERVEGIAGSERAAKHVRSLAAYAAVLFAAELGETERARRAHAVLRTVAAGADVGMRRDVERRFAHLIPEPAPEGEAK